MLLIGNARAYCSGLAASNGTPSQSANFWTGAILGVTPSSFIASM